MAENLALVKKKQKKFNSSVKTVKKLLNKGEIKVSEKPIITKKHRRPERGIIYLGNIPHGFYEEQMREYFRQFGFVTRIRLSRSKRTGKSRGFAFIEFREPEVAKIVAETMDNYLMGKRLLKAQYIPPEKQHRRYFLGKSYTATNYPKKANRTRNIKVTLETGNSEGGSVVESRRILKKIEKITKTLHKYSIPYVFKPVNIPEELIVKKSEPKEEQSSESEPECEPLMPSYSKKSKLLKVGGVKKVKKMAPVMNRKKLKLLKQEPLISTQFTLRSGKKVQKIK